MSSSPAQGLSKEDTIGILGIPKWTNETPLARDMSRIIERDP